MIGGLRSLAAKSGPQVTRFDIDDAIEEVLALTRSELQQVLLNLIMNGVEAMGAVRGQPKVLAIT